MTIETSAKIVVENIYNDDFTTLKEDVSNLISSKAFDILESKKAAVGKKYFKSSFAARVADALERKEKEEDERQDQEKKKISEALFQSKKSRIYRDVPRNIDALHNTRYKGLIPKILARHPDGTVSVQFTNNPSSVN